MNLSINPSITLLTIAIILLFGIGYNFKYVYKKNTKNSSRDDHKALITNSIDQNPSWAGNFLINYPLTDSPLTEFRSTQYLGFFIDPTCGLSYRQVDLDASFRNESGMRVLDLKSDSSGEELFYIASSSDDQDVQTVYPTSDVLTPLCDQDNLDLDRLGLSVTPGDTMKYSIDASKIQIVAGDSDLYEVYAISSGVKTKLIQHHHVQRTQHQPLPLLIWVGDYNNDGFVDLVMKTNIYPEYRTGDYVLLSSSDNGKLSIMGVFSTQVV